MKKNLRLVLVIALLVLAAVIGFMAGRNAPPSDYEYRTVVSGIAITKYVGDGNEAVIPAKIKGQPVTKIDDRAFDGRTRKGCKNLTAVTIPDSVTAIGNQAFYSCDRLTEITVPNGVTSIGDEAFSACDRLSSVTIPDSVTTMGSNPFFGSGSLQTISVGEGNSAYSSLDGVLYSKDRTVLIAYPAGKRDTGFTVPGSVTRIEDSAFSHCKNLAAVSIPDTVTSIGLQAFCFCSNLTSVTIPRGITSIENWTFENTGLTSVVIPENVTSIGQAAFRESGLTAVTIPSGVTTIEEKAFLGCANLKTVTVQGRLASIGDRAFKGCSSLSDIYFSGSNMEWYTIDVGVENAPLTGADVHFNAAEP